MEGTTYECVRCGREFSKTGVHTEIVRRDFIEVPQPSRVERLCQDCLEAYVADFLGEEFDSLVTEYDMVE
ncbi:MAG: hypothetical protein ABEH90_02620 [Halolamina sp.]